MKKSFSLIPVLIFVLISYQTIKAQNIFGLLEVGKIDSVKNIIEKNPTLVNLKNEKKLTPLHFAIGIGNKDFIVYLLNKGADVNAKDFEGRAPLFFSIVVSGDIEITKLLVEKGADINSKDNGQRPIIVWSAMRGFRDLTEYLFDLGAEIPSVNDKAGKDLLNSSVEFGMVKILDKLIASGANVLEKDKVGNNLLHQAASGGSTLLIDRLISAGIKINDKNNSGWTPLHFAAEGGFRETSAKLIERGVDINALTNGGFSAYNLAVEIGNQDIIDLLISKKADICLPKMQRLKGEYFGQKVPSNIPEIFAPGFISRENSGEYACTFSQDGKEFYFTKTSSTQHIMFSKLENDGWTFPQVVSFSKGFSAHEPHVAYDNKRIFWGWFKPVPKNEIQMMPNYGIYMSERISDGWSEAKYVGPGMFVSSSSDGRFYLTGNGLEEVKFINGRFTSNEPLKGMDNIKKQYGGGAHPCIAPDGSYIVFDVEGGYHLFVSFRNGDGNWSDAIDLTDHGFDPKAGIASISPDGKYLFFGCKGDIYWVSTKLIDELKMAKE